MATILPAWAWFVICVIAAVAGVAMLARDRALHTARNRERRRWATLRGWQFAETDHVLPTRWQHGAIAYYGNGAARDVVAGSTFTADGRRQVYILDLEISNKISTTLVAIRCRRSTPVVIELWLSSVPFQRDQMPDLLGPVGQRYAFVTDVEAARRVINSDIADITEEIGSDVPVVWFEGEWVVAAAPAGSTPARLERVLRNVGELADVIDPFEVDPNDDHDHQAAIKVPEQQQEHSSEVYRPSFGGRNG